MLLGSRQPATQLDKHVWRTHCCVWALPIRLGMRLRRQRPAAARPASGRQSLRLYRHAVVSDQGARQSCERLNDYSLPHNGPALIRARVQVARAEEMNPFRPHSSVLGIVNSRSTALDPSEFVKVPLIFVSGSYVL